MAILSRLALNFYHTFSFKNQTGLKHQKYKHRFKIYMYLLYIYLKLHNKVRFDSSHIIMHDESSLDSLKKKTQKYFPKELEVRCLSHKAITSTAFRKQFLI